VGVLVFAYGKWVRGMEFVELFQAVVGIAVSMIPEGLPALITILACSEWLNAARSYEGCLL